MPLRLPHAFFVPTTTSPPHCYATGPFLSPAHAAEKDLDATRRLGDILPRSEPEDRAAGRLDKMSGRLVRDECVDPLEATPLKKS